MNFAVPQTKFKRKNDRILKYKSCCKGAVCRKFFNISMINKVLKKIAVQEYPLILKLPVFFFVG